VKHLNKIPKIGIFGWTGTGKTIYISMLHYLLSSNKHPYVIGSRVDDIDIQKNMKIFLENTSWESITEKIKGSIHTSELLFILNTKDGSKQFEIQDYRGEDVEKQEDKSEEATYNYFLGCDALLFFLDAEAFENNDKLANWHRWDEFQELLHKLSLNNKSKKVKIPIYLVITKKDILTFDNNGEIQMASSKIKETYNDKLRVISQYCESTKPFFISSKLCFDFYVKNDEKDTKELIDFCTPITRSLKEIEINQKNELKLQQQQEQKERKKKIQQQQEQEEEEKQKLINNIFKKVGIGITILTLMYTLFYFNYNSNLVQIETNGSDIESLKRFKAETPLSFFPTLEIRVEELLNGQSEILLESIRNHAKKIREYDTTLKLMEEFKEKNFSYNEKEFNNITNNIQSYLINKIQNYSIIDSDRLDLLNDFFEKYFKTNESQSNISNKLLNKLKKINEDAKIIQQIKNASDYAIILPLCEKHNRLKTGYFNDTIIAPCNTAKENKKIAQDNLEKKRLQLEAERIRDELKIEKNKSAWDKFWE
jgi:hypothetical protein